MERSHHTLRINRIAKSTQTELHNRPENSSPAPARGVDLHQYREGAYGRTVVAVITLSSRHAYGELISKLGARLAGNCAGPGSKSPGCARPIQGETGMTYYKQLGVLCHANLEATQRTEVFALEAGATVLRTQMDAAQELIRNSSEPLRALSATTPDERDVADQFVIWSDIMKRTLEAARIWVEATVRAQTDLSRITGTHLPAAGQSLIQAWLSAAKAGHEVSAVTERHHRKIAESQTRKAA